ncbi:4-diphosphocytidyl-2C-methyl-D-erythritol kinase [Actinoplanes sp. SE50]|uniref:4-(cytidine 5'-diphospho)-2-C-methyl-D-erythritol kinase n=1 Tax=unclassified Actinoplanes TaxID=2626549 RepID=UPI00023EDDFC|nr:MULTISPECIES: 4-(cytidine 5'-diphospho)-2-C-methyl-D-erythritol kinase [unclassified Actinoplanes]AEV88674.1 4-diphosphocytidyl-2-C-methyl-D-erythritol kinase [Actinoplanes sp. SE50/110]ATO87078.1 4-diphosphocytidyl-2C-methyl-D-erythritol kinase [Actinoplanes sp. SE50]SLM04496.1 4-(cytidine 5'-diphospho)-2-C-methyl-D-erythritol kinase [Actinoplanes sp. SE50/110]
MTEAWGPDDDEPRPYSGPVKVRVPAKINLHLAVGPLRPDGYHELNTVYHAISLFDEITARHGDTLTLTMEGEGTGDLALDETNLIIRAARALAARARVPAYARLHLRKSIPLAGGLAGGSADAAATLIACDLLWGLGMSRDELAEVGAQLGSDIPFLLHGGTALGTGHGEAVSPILARPTTWHWTVAIADGGLATPAVYRELDTLRAGTWPPTPLGSADTLMAALRQRNPEILGAALGNDLQPAALALRPQLADVLKAGTEAGALAGLVSGSGPTCVFLAADATHAQEIADSLTEAGVCRAAVTARGPQPGARVI